MERCWTVGDVGVFHKQAMSINGGLGGGLKVNMWVRANDIKGAGCWEV